MLQQGFSLGDAIEFLLMNFNSKDHQSIQLVRNELNNGSMLHEILQKLDFPPFICLQVLLAERHGNLAETCIYAGERWKRNEEARRKFLKLLQYPLFLFILLFLLLILLNLFLLPRFEVLYTSIGFTPQSGTKFLLFFLKTAPPIVMFAFLLFVTLTLCFLAYFFKQSPKNKVKIMLKIPFLNEYFRLYLTQMFSKEFSQLLSNGFAVNEILFIFQEQKLHPILNYIATEMNEQLILGSSLAKVVKNIPLFKNELSRMVHHGEVNGRLDVELQLFSQFCEQQLEDKIKKVLTFLQPTMFILVGMTVIAIYLSVMLPMFQMVESF
ncbi:competence protein ComGB [Oikeobacillus pervagus]|uniref:Competence protein ComGB n=2 Tax=Oikeobacillus pervagus TaxID=1325931 RepID=A0AAJ1WHZ9_9BACI|nr:competence protein ComGB [Oikeobacillus pervagus]